MRKYAHLAALLLAACSKSGSLAAITVDSAIPLADVQRLHLTAKASGRTLDIGIPLATHTFPPSHTFGVDLSSDLSGTLQVDLSAIDSSGAILGAGSASMNIVAGQRIDLTVTLNGGALPDMATADLTGVDQATLDDSSVPIDLGTTDAAHAPLVFTAKNLTAAGLFAIWGSDATHVWLSGHSSANTYFSVGDDTWTQYSTNPFYGVNGVWGTSTTKAWMVDDNADVRILNSTGTAWGTGLSLTGATNLSAVWGTSATNIWIISNDGTTGAVFHNTVGTNVAGSWTKPHTDTFGYNAIAGAAANDFYIVGDAGNILRADGTTNGFTYHNLGAEALRGVFAADGTHVYAVGDHGTLGFSIGNGIFAQQNLPAGHTTTNLHAVWASAIDDIYVVGDNGTILHSIGNGTWTVRTSGLEGMSPPHNLTALWGSGAGNVYAVSDQGDVVHGH